MTGRNLALIFFSFNQTEQLAVEAREQDKAALAKLQTRTNYLKNPRHDVSQVQLLTVADKIQAKEVNIKQPPASAKPISQVQVCTEFYSTCMNIYLFVIL